MDLNQLRELLELVREHELSEFEIEHEGLRLKVRKDATGTMAAMPSAPPVAANATPAAPPAAAPARTGPAAAAAPATALPEAADADAEIELAVVKSPIVGTFY